MENGDLRTGQERVVVCGSMVFMPLMGRIASDLAGMGVPSVVPEFVDSAAEFGTQDEWIAFKRQVSLAHFEKIRDSRTVGIVVANFPKLGIRSYVGPNTLAEIAIAFVHGKKVWMVDGIPNSCDDELLAWGAVDVGGNLRRVAEDYLAPVHLRPTDGAS